MESNNTSTITIVYEGALYNVTDFVDRHPGGGYYIAMSKG